MLSKDNKLHNVLRQSRLLTARKIIVYMREFLSVRARKEEDREKKGIIRIYIYIYSYQKFIADCRIEFNVINASTSICIYQSSLHIFRTFSAILTGLRNEIQLRCIFRYIEHSSFM